MEIRFDVAGLLEGLEQLAGELDSAAEQAMRTSLDLVAATAKELAPKGATSSLANSIQALPPRGSFSEGTLAGEVFAGAPYAMAHEEGARPHVIRAKFRKALRIPIEGGFRFRRAVNHPGNKPQPFMAPALERHAEDIAGEFGAAVELAIRKAGF